MSGRVALGVLGAVALALLAGAPARRVASADEDIYFPADRETLALAAPPLELRRPDKDWVFIDVAKQRAALASSRPAAALEAEFQRLEARVHNAPLRALVSVYVERLDRAPPTVAELEAHIRGLVAKLGKASVVEAGRCLLGADEAARIDYVAVTENPSGVREAPGGVSNVYYYSRVDIPRPAARAVVTLFFEVPKERLAKAKPGWVKLLKRLKLG